MAGVPSRTITFMRAKADQIVAAVLGVLTCLEIALRDDLASPVFSAVIGLSIALAVSLRSRYPLGVTLATFGVVTIATIVETILHVPSAGPYTGIAILLLPYTLFRWCNPRSLQLGAGVMALTFTASAIHGELKSVSEAIGGLVVLFFPAVLGSLVRSRASAFQRDIEHARMRERELLARELHDSVAHHMTAIAIQSQAARAVLSSRPEAAVAALGAIEHESRRTLSELREIVRALRDEHDAETSPLGRIVEIKSFERHGEGLPQVVVRLEGSVERVPPAVDRAVYRLVQESVTNALKHARRASRVEVEVVVDPKRVRLRVVDDGEPVVTREESRGFGIVGMRERAALLGGTFRAGPGVSSGWRVEAELPMETQPT